MISTSGKSCRKEQCENYPADKKQYKMTLPFSFCPTKPNLTAATAAKKKKERKE